MSDAPSQPQFDVFLSHNSRDKQAVVRLTEKLTEVGLRPWLDSQRLTPGGRWQDELAEGLAACRSCAVFLGPHGMGDWVWEELGLATDRAAKDRTFRLFPVLLPGVPDPFDPTSLPPFLRARNWVDLRLGYEDPRLFNRLVNAIKGMSIDDETPVATGECPYRGLQVFDEDHAEYYFGREADVQRLLEKLKESRVLGIVGPSGSGKSSLARAGLIPAIRAGRLPGSHSWTTAVFTPGQHPLTALTAQICRHLPDRAPGTVLDLMTSDSRTLHLETEVILAGRPESDRLVLIIDQLEEIFTLCRDDDERTRFLDALLYAAEIPGGRTIVLFTLRADFYPRCAAFPNLATSLGAHHYLVGPMTEDGLRRAIEQPAHKVGLTFDEGLVDTILDDVIREPGALPLLEHALLELWDRRRGQRLTLQGYKESGGVRGAIAARADAVYATLSPEQQGLVRQVMLRLTEPGEGTEDTRRRASLDELVSNIKHRGALEAAIGALADARLLIVSGDEGDDEAVVDVAHEALIRGWPRLRQWLDEDRAGLRVLRQLTESAEEWQRRGRDESLLYRGVRLLEATDLRDRVADSLNEEERTFIDESVALRDREHRERERAQRARERTQRKIVIGLAAGLAVALLLSLLAWNQRSEARAGRRDAAAGREVAVTRAAEADAARQTAQVDRSNAEAQSTVAADEKAGADAARQTAESRRVEAEGAQATAESRRVEAETAQQTAQADRAEAEAQSTVAANERVGAEGARKTAEARRVEAENAQATADAQRVAAENAQGTAEARRVEAENAQGTAEAERQAAEVARTDALVRYLAGESRSDTITNDAALLVSVEALALRPDLPQARGALDSALQREHHLKKYLPQSVSDRNAIRAMTFSPILTQPTLAIADRWAKSVTIWDINAGRPLGDPLTDLPAEIWSLAYSPDGLMLAVGCQDGSVTLWNPITHSRRRLVLTSDGTTVAALAFNATGTQLVGTMESGAVFVWNVTTAETTGRAIGQHTGIAWDVAFIPGTDTFATASQDGEIRFWDLASFAETGDPLTSDQDSEFWSLTIDPTGKTLVALDSLGQMSFWNIEKRDRISQPIVLGQLMSMARIVNDDNGPLVIATGRTGSVFEVDLATRQLRQVYDGHRALVETLAVSSDGRTVATADISNSVILWDTAQSARYAKPFVDEDSAQLTVDVSPDGTLLATGGADGRVTIWDVKTKSAKAVVNAHNGAVNDLVFSPSGDTIATAGADGKVVLWESTSGDEIASFDGEDRVAIDAVAFSSDGKRLLSGDQNGAVSLWDLNDPTAPAVSAGELPGPVDDVTFGEGNDILAVGRNGAISWNTESESVVWSTGESFQAVVFLPDRHLYAFGGVDGTVYLVNTETFDGLISYKAHSSAITDLAVNLKGRYLAASGQGGAITLIDLDAHYAVGGPGRDNLDSTINAIDYAPNGSWIVSAEMDGQIIIWDVDADSWVATACSVANRNLTAYEWADYMGDLPYRDTCPALESGRDITEVVTPASPEAEDPFDGSRELGN